MGIILPRLHTGVLTSASQSFVESKFFDESSLKL